MTGPDLPAAAGLPVMQVAVQPDWVDHNGHMNVAAYLIAFDRACCGFSSMAGIGPDRIASGGHTIFVGQANLAYRREVLLTDRIAIGARVPAMAPDRKHLLLSMYRLRDGEPPELAAICEELCVCVAMTTRRPAPFPPEVAEWFGAALAREAALPPPDLTTGAISLAPRKRKAAP